MKNPQDLHFLTDLILFDLYANEYTEVFANRMRELSAIISITNEEKNFFSKSMIFDREEPYSCLLGFEKPISKFIRDYGDIARKYHISKLFHFITSREFLSDPRGELNIYLGSDDPQDQAYISFYMECDFDWHKFYDRCEIISMLNKNFLKEIKDLLIEFGNQLCSFHENLNDPPYNILKLYDSIAIRAKKHLNILLDDQPITSAFVNAYSYNENMTITLKTLLRFNIK